jgi:hypothetical protein
LAAIFGLLALLATGESLNWWNIWPEGPDVHRTPAGRSFWERS